MITFGQLFLAVSLPTVVALIGVVLNQLSNKGLGNEIKELANELKNFRIEMAKELGILTTRIAVIETKLEIVPPPTKTEPAKEVAA